MKHILKSKHHFIINRNVKRKIHFTRQETKKLDMFYDINQLNHCKMLSAFVFCVAQSGKKIALHRICRYRDS